MRLMGLAAIASLPLLAQDGAALYRRHCSYCHGANGEGGRGPDLTTGRYRRAQTDSDLFSVIRNGVRGTEMPAVRASDDEVRQLVAHVRSLVVRSESVATGDAAAGAQVFQQCAGCHPGLGPDLRDSAARGPVYLRESLLKPDAEIAYGYRAVRITLKDGSTVAGIRLNEDDVSVQVRDESSRLRSFPKAEIVSIDRSKPSLMPSFQGRLSERQIDDVIAYVMGLR